MTKGFMEVFPELALEQEVRALFEKVKVERVTTTRQKDLIRVYISCGRLIPKTVIFRVEEEIARQLFPNCNITIKIQEKFQLSAQYNLKSLLETYQESILLELKECSPVEYSLFKSANISFPDEGKLVLEVPDTVIAHERCPELVRILEKICCERCGIEGKSEKSGGRDCTGKKSGDDCRESGCSSGCDGLWHEPGAVRQRNERRIQCVR